MASRSNPFPPFENHVLANAPTLPRGPRADARFGDLDSFRNPPVQVQTDSSSDDDMHPSLPTARPRQSLHSRSLSHPFPPLFGSKKKLLPENGEPTDDDTLRNKRPATTRSAMPPRKNLRGPIDFANGNCMTCGGLVRWPKELDVFRCTICLTINDLKPSNPGREGRRNAEGPRTISLGHTRSLIRESLRSALRSFISRTQRHANPERRPSASPPRGADEFFALFDQPARQDRSPSIGDAPPIFICSAVFDDNAESTAEPAPPNRKSLTHRSYSASCADSWSGNPTQGLLQAEEEELEPKKIFKALEDYLIKCFGSHAVVNSSFIPRSRSFSSRPPGEPVKRPSNEIQRVPTHDDTLVSELDPKLLLLGNFAENGAWWTGEQEILPQKPHSRRKEEGPSLVTHRSPRIDWGEVQEWYHTVVNAAEPWTELYREMTAGDSSGDLAESEQHQLKRLLLDAQEHMQRVLLKCTEMLLKRPGRLLRDPQDIRFLLIILANPLLVPHTKNSTPTYQRSRTGTGLLLGACSRSDDHHALGRHSVIIKRIVGLISQSSEQCHHHLVTWLAKLPESLFVQIKDLVGNFVTYRLTRQNEKKVEPKVDMMADLIPQMPNNRSGNTPALLHAALETSNGSKRQKHFIEQKQLAYSNDWQIKAGARVMALLFAANNLTRIRRKESSAKHANGHLLETSDFYNSLLDCLDFKTDFELWESKKSKFAFCQYPFFLSIWAKIQILEFDAKRQMSGKAREDFFNSILTHRTFTQYLFLSVRRECLIEDSLKQVSEVVGSGSDDIKKGLRIEFQGEEGVDAGGLRKEWFLLLVREVFNPEHGLFAFDEDSRYCYFNPHTFETSDQFFLVGVVLGLAIYNSTILDVALPPFAFRKLLAAAPAPTSSTSTSAYQRAPMTYSLDDLAEYRPRLADGLRKLLEYDGDVQSTFCLDFVIETEKYGSRVQVPLYPGGENRPVTNSNRQEYVDLYVRYLLDTSVSRQFEPFKRGFFTVCAGNALSLFRPEEIELLVRGSDEALDITSLRAVATYSGWNPADKNESSEPKGEPVVNWFWHAFGTASPKDQRRLLSFITGSDRIPATGAASLTIKIHCLGDDVGRYPTARTCFNVLNLYRYPSSAKLEEFLWRAVNESEGFGLK